MLFVIHFHGQESPGKLLDVWSLKEMWTNAIMLVTPQL